MTTRSPPSLRLLGKTRLGSGLTPLRDFITARHVGRGADRMRRENRFDGGVEGNAAGRKVLWQSQVRSRYQARPVELFSTPPKCLQHFGGDRIEPTHFFETLFPRGSTYAWRLSECANTLSGSGKRHST